MNIQTRRHYAPVGHARAVVTGAGWRRLVAAAAAALVFAVAPAWSQDAVTNQARVVNPPGVECTDLVDNPECSREASVTTPVVPPSAAAYDFCPAGGPQPIFSLTNGAFIARYMPGAGADAPEPLLDAPAAGGGNTNGLMIDPVRNRMLFISRAGSNSILWAYDAANGGWYVAQSAFASPDFPRAGMTADGVGYLIAGGSATPQVWRVVADPAPGSFGYSASLAGTLSYDQPPTDTNSGDIAFDAAGDGWLVAGQDLYRFDPDTLVAVRQTRPTLGGAPSTVNWAGVAFADNGDLYVANNNSPSRYFAYDPATGELTQMAPTGANASRDLASCAFPVVTEPELSVGKTLATVNGEAYVPGSPVAAGDVLAYLITFNNSGGAVGTLFPGDVVETLPEHTSVVTLGNDFTCTGSSCINTAALNVPASGSATLNFIVQIDDPIPEAVSAIANAITVAGLDCDAPENDCSELTPVGPVVSVSKSLDVGAGTPVALGDTLTYTLTATVANAATFEPVVLTDTLSAGLVFGEVTLPGDFSCNAASPLVCTLPGGQAPGTYSVVYTATVAADAMTAVSNSVVTDTGSCAVCEIENPVAPSVVIEKSADPSDGSTVAAGDELTYTVTATVSASATTADVVLTDTLGAGLSFGSVISTPVGASCVGTNPIVCTLPAGALPGSYAFVYTASVDADATGSVGNVVIASGDDAPECPVGGCETVHPVVDPTVVVTKSADPANGSTVAPGDELTYTVTATVSDSATTDDVVLTDTLGAGLSFGAILSTPAGASCAGTNPIVCTLPAGALPGSYAFVYTASVDADATGSVGNVVLASGNDAPECPVGDCETEHPVIDASVVVTKSADPSNGSTVSPGDELTYTVTATVSDSATTDDVVLTDTLGAGLSFGAIVSTPVGASCVGTNPIVCTLPAGVLPGSYAFVYTASVDADATGSVGNVVIASGDDAPECPVGDCETGHPVVDPTVVVTKAADPANGSTVAPGEELTYTVTATVSDSATTGDVVLTDTLGAGLSFGAIVSTPVGASCAGTNPIVCTLPAGALPGSYAFVYTASVDADATGSVGNVVIASGDDAPECPVGGCETVHPVVDPTVVVTKSADPANGSTVAPGDELTYTVTATVSDSATTADVVLTDTLGAGLSLGSVVSTPAGASCAGTNPIVCTLPAGALPGSYAFVYTASVDADATGSVGNVVIASGDDAPECPVGGCETEHPVIDPSVSVSKSVALPLEREDGMARPGDLLTYSIRVLVADSATTADLLLTDTLSGAQTLVEVTSLPAGGACDGGSPLLCTLAAGTLPGEYTFVYTARVDDNASGSVGNLVLPSGPDQPECPTAGCETSTPIAEPRVSYAKLAQPGSGSEVSAGDIISYVLSATIAESSLTQPLVLVDTLGAGLTLASVPEGCEAQGQVLTCTLVAGTAPGNYTFEYSASVDADASGTLGNSVTGSGGGGEPPVCGASCETEHQLVEPVLVLAKASDPASGSEVAVGQTITYTLSVTVSGAATLSDVVLVDTPDAGLDIGALPAGCSFNGGVLTCVLPQGSVPGIYNFIYEAVVNASAGPVLDNVVTGTGGGTPGSGTVPSCEVCSTRHELQDRAQLRLSKQAGARRARVGDLVRYTLTIENVGATNVTDAHVIDNAPVGFSYVDGTLSVVDRDNAGTISGHNPMRIGGLDIDAGGTATVVYLMRVGAGVRAGEQVNQAQVFDSGDNPVSGIATASLLLDGDPMLDEALVFGTVFDDRDGDGWQDSAELAGLRLHGLAGAGAISIDRGTGPQPASLDSDGSLALGVLAGRQSVAEPASARRIVVSQRVQDPSPHAAIVLESRQGIRLSMDAQGEVTTDRQGEASRGLTAAAPTLERVVAVDGDGYVVDYVITNEGIDERGIPGVRIASVEGLLMETDAFGRYHLIGVHGGLPERGRNFILKVDPATLPAGAEFSTDNPLLRRVTPGLPVRFDFGVQLPVQQIEGGRREVELDLGEIIFAPGSAVVRDAYLPVLDSLAARIAGYEHGQVAIEAGAENLALAMDRAIAVRDALARALPAGLPAGVEVVVRTRVDVPEGLVAGVGRDGALLGTVLFDTDRSEIKAEFAPLLGRVATWLDAYDGGVVSIVGHTDPRAPATYNLALGMRRAQAVLDALMPALSPETRSRVRVVPVNPASGPAGERHE